jgi:hypothetical protein
LILVADRTQPALTSRDARPTFTIEAKFGYQTKSRRIELGLRGWVLRSNVAAQIDKRPLAAIKHFETRLAAKPTAQNSFRQERPTSDRVPHNKFISFCDS